MFLTMATAVALLISLVGILLNTSVIRRLHKFARLEPNRFEHGCGLPLMVMATADLLTLVAVVVFSVPRYIVINEFSSNINSTLPDVLCKSRIIWTQVTTNISIWCWVLMSVMRYMAVYHPLLQLRLWHLPRRGVQIIVLLSLLFNIIFFVAIQFRKEQCQDTSMLGWQTTARWLSLTEICWDFFIPLLCMLFMDGRVLLTSPPSMLVRRHHVETVRAGTMQSLDAVELLRLHDTSPSSEKIPNRSTHRMRQSILNWLTVTSLNLLLNAPENILRLVVMFAGEDGSFEQRYWSVRFASQLCYFGQFAIKAVFLSILVYNRSIKPKRSTTALSMVQHSLMAVSTPMRATGGANSQASLSSLQSSPSAVHADPSELDEEIQAGCRPIRTYTL